MHWRLVVQVLQERDMDCHEIFPVFNWVSDLVDFLDYVTVLR